MGQMSLFPVPLAARLWTAERISSFDAFILKAEIQRHRGHSEIIFGSRKSSGHGNYLAKMLLLGHTIPGICQGRDGVASRSVLARQFPWPELDYDSFC